MPELLSLPPPPNIIAALSAIPGVKITPNVVATQQGLDNHLGPESAGAILMLQATFHSEDGNTRFWEALVPMYEKLAVAPGFIRYFAFGDGPSNTLIAFWRTMAEAKAFAASSEHREAVQRLFRERWEYTHFAALWEMKANHGRIVFCEACDGITPVGQGACSGCGAGLTNIYSAS